MVIENKKVRYDYFVEDELEVGIVLSGNEVKSIRDGQASIKEAWVRVQNGTLVLRGMHITKWSTANDFVVDEDRERILLAHRKEINRLADRVKLDGVTLIPLRVYFTKEGKCKILLGICKGKHNYDKRQSLRDKQVSRDIQRGLKNNA